MNITVTNQLTFFEPGMSRKTVNICVCRCHVDNDSETHCKNDCSCKNDNYIHDIYENNICFFDDK